MKKRTGGRRDKYLLGGDRFSGTFLAIFLVVAGRTLLNILFMVLRPECRRRPRWRDVHRCYYVVCEQRRGFHH